jgi:plasmid maintenance system antidote protein VapI
VSVLAYKVGRCLLREHLNNARLTQSELAAILDITVQQVNKYVTGRQMMSYQTAKNISVVVRCRMEDLYEWHEVGYNE